MFFIKNFKFSKKISNISKILKFSKNYEFKKNWIFPELFCEHSFLIFLQFSTKKCHSNSDQLKVSKDISSKGNFSRDGSSEHLEVYDLENYGTTQWNVIEVHPSVRAVGMR